MALLQEIYSKASQLNHRRQYRSVLGNLQNALSLFLGRRCISKGSQFQVEGPTMENARHCLVTSVPFYAIHPQIIGLVLYTILPLFLPACLNICVPVWAYLEL